jgi:IS1 family transposase/transposase-like protein
MKCNFCKGNCTKAGRQKSGQQRYCCKSCKKYQQADYKYAAYKKEVIELIPVLVCESVSIRGISRVLKIGLRTVVRKIKSIANVVSKPVIPLDRSAFELDEVRTYINRKENQYWIAYALCSETKQVVDFIVGKRSKRTLRMIVNTLLISGGQTIRTDKLNIYQTLIPADRHIANAYNINHMVMLSISSF